MDIFWTSFSASSPFSVLLKIWFGSEGEPHIQARDHELELSVCALDFEFDYHCPWWEYQSDFMHTYTTKAWRRCRPRNSSWWRCQDVGIPVVHQAVAKNITVNSVSSEFSKSDYYWFPKLQDESLWVHADLGLDETQKPKKHAYLPKMKQAAKMLHTHSHTQSSYEKVKKYFIRSNQQPREWFTKYLS